MYIFIYTYICITCTLLWFVVVFRFRWTGFVAWNQLLVKFQLLMPGTNLCLPATYWKWSIRWWLFQCLPKCLHAASVAQAGAGARPRQQRRHYISATLAVDVDWIGIGINKSVNNIGNMLINTVHCALSKCSIYVHIYAHFVIPHIEAEYMAHR